MKTIEILDLQNTLQLEPIIRLLEHKTYLNDEQIDEILALGEAGLSEMRLILKAYNQKVKDLRKFDSNLCFLAHIVDFFTELRDEAALEDVITALKVDFDMAEIAMSDGIMDYLPDYFALFPHRIDTFRTFLWDADLDLNTKNAIFAGLGRAIRVLNIKTQPQPILKLFEDYFHFLQVSQNRIEQDTQANCEYAYTLPEFIAFILIEYEEAGGDKKSDLVKYFFDNDLIDETIIGDYIDFMSTDKVDYPIEIYSIYKKNEIWRDIITPETKPTANKRKKQSTNWSPPAWSYGRNDKVNVRYNDGKIVKDIKFKKVEDDLHKGLCIVID
jgi:hypothetical protein